MHFIGNVLTHSSETVECAFVTVFIHFAVKRGKKEIKFQPFPCSITNTILSLSFNGSICWIYMLDFWMKSNLLRFGEMQVISRIFDYEWAWCDRHNSVDS